MPSPSWGASDCWVRNIRIVNGQRPVLLNGSSFVTLDGVVFEASRQPAKNGRDGSSWRDHRRRQPADQLRFSLQIYPRRISGWKGFEAEASFPEGAGKTSASITTSGFPARIFLPTSISEKARLYKCGGGDNLGRHSAAWTTFLESALQAAGVKFPRQLWPRLDECHRGSLGAWSRQFLTRAAFRFEPIAPGSLHRPANLYEAQRALRSKERRPLRNNRNGRTRLHQT